MTGGIFLLLGSNLKDKKKQIEYAIEQISVNLGPILKISSIYETAAWGIEDQPTFYNQIIEIDSNILSEKMLAIILNIEKDMGRIRAQKWGARIIDIDILYYKDQITKQDNLHIPHPGIPVRRFTLIPLAEIAPDFVHPELKKTNQQLLVECADNLEVKKIG